MGLNRPKLPLLLERGGERRIKSTGYIPPHPGLLPQGRRRDHLCRYLCSIKRDKIKAIFWFSDSLNSYNLLMINAGGQGIEVIKSSINPDETAILFPYKLKKRFMPIKYNFDERAWNR